MVVKLISEFRRRKVKTYGDLIYLVDFSTVVYKRQLLQLPVCFPAHKATSDKKAT